MNVSSRRRTRTSADRRPSDRHRSRFLNVEALEERNLLTLLGQQIFPSDNPWNQQVTNAPVAANSGAILNNIIAQSGKDGHLHPDFSQDAGGASPLYGIPYNVVHGNTQPKVHVTVDAYAGESDLMDAPVPSGVVLEGDLQNGPTVGLSNRGDSHMLVYDADNNVAYEFYHASRPAENSDGQWHADGEAVWDFKANTFRTIGWSSVDAAGLPVLPGLVRPDEALPVSQGGQGVIDHAIRFTLQNSLILNQFLYPGEHNANPGNTNAAVQPPMGSRFRLKAGVDTSQLDPQSKVIAQAMKDYGLILADNGSNFFFSGASYSVDAGNQKTMTWNDADIWDSTHGIGSLTYSDFEVVDLTPRVTGLSASAGAAGATVTVVGQNFSGAAGHLQVLFGGSAATNVRVVDDTHVTATVPAGSGAVDVRVQSGVTTPSDPANVKGTVFGYGVSATAPGDVFTYQAQNRPPVAAADAASTAAGVPVTVAVLANDSDPDGDPLAVAAVTQPAGGAAAVNPDNTVTYTPKAGFSGTDSFTYTASDGRGGTATAAVTVTVAAAPARSEWVVNVGDPGYAQAGDNWSPGWGGDPAGFPYRTDSTHAGTWTTPGTATWTVPGLPAGTYRVYATWFANPYWTTAAPYTVLGNGAALASLKVNQQAAPADATAGGRGWASLGTFTIGGGSLAVRLSDGNPTGAAVADSVRVVAVPPADRPPVAAADAASTAAGVPVTVAVLANDSDPDGDPLAVAAVTQPAGGAAAVNPDNTVTYTPKAGFSGTDSFTYTASDGRGGTATAAVTVTVAAAPARSEWVVNVGDPGYAQVGDNWSPGWGGDPAGFPYRTDSTHAGTWTTPGTATWTVPGLPAGTYRVYATWFANPYWTTAAPYTVLGNGAALASLKVNQQAAPADATAGGRGWASLGTFTIGGGSLAVRLSDGNPTGAAVADSVRVVAVPPAGSPAPATTRVAFAAQAPALAPNVIVIGPPDLAGAAFATTGFGPLTTTPSQIPARKRTSGTV